MRGLSIFLKNLLLKHLQVLINISGWNLRKIRKRTYLLLIFQWILLELEVLILNWLIYSEELLLQGDYHILLLKNMELNISKGFSYTDLQELEKHWLPGNLQKLSKQNLWILSMGLKFSVNSLESHRRTSGSYSNLLVRTRKNMGMKVPFMWLFLIKLTQSVVREDQKDQEQVKIILFRCKRRSCEPVIDKLGWCLGLE